MAGAFLLFVVPVVFVVLTAFRSGAFRHFHTRAKPGEFKPFLRFDREKIYP
jgi:hypothetical protein